MKYTGHSTKITKLFHRLVLTSIPVIVVLSTYKIFLSRTGHEDFKAFDLPVGFYFFMTISLVLAMAFLNWFLESWKWKSMISNFHNAGWKEAYRSVLAGISLGFITPGRVGDYLGKSWFLENKISGVAIAVVSGIIQSIVTFGIGLIALLIFFASDFYLENSFLPSSGIVLISLAACGFFLLFLIYPSLFCSILGRAPFLSGLVKKIEEPLSSFSWKQLFFFLQISFLRYIVFSMQFLVLLILFGVHETIFVLSVKIALVFFFSSLIPSFLFGKIGVRETFALLLIGIPSLQNTEVLTASLTLWIINQVIPALIGSVFFLAPKPKEVS